MRVNWMETKGKRASRAVAPVEIPMPQVMPAPASGEVVEIATQPNPAPAVAVAPRVSPALLVASASREDLTDIGREAFAALAESRAVLAHGVESMSDELAGLARNGIDTAARTAIEMLAVRTLSDAIEVNAGFARTSFDNWIGSSARLSELGARLAADAAQPFLACFGKCWTGVRRLGY
jgi:hypothetical protein